MVTPANLAHGRAMAEFLRGPEYADRCFWVTRTDLLVQLESTWTPTQAFIDSEPRRMGAELHHEPSFDLYHPDDRNHPLVRLVNPKIPEYL